ncbi:MAG: hypothetical protein JEZ06_19930 [Anaerolineaceae bacterium]|nr:hypothetical protein [Anaerolineaceae bacterium]
MIAHPDNPYTDLSQDQVIGMFSGEIKKWNQLDNSLSLTDEIEIWVYPETHESQYIFNSSIMSQNSLNNPDAFIAPTIIAMLEIIPQNKSSIGFIPKKWLNGKVKKISIKDGLGFSIEPILLSSNTKLNPAQESFIHCLQNQIK